MTIETWRSRIELVEGWCITRTRGMRIHMNPPGTVSDPPPKGTRVVAFGTFAAMGSAMRLMQVERPSA